MKRNHIFTFADTDIDSAYIRHGGMTTPLDHVISHHQPATLTRGFSNSPLQSFLQYFSGISANQHISMECRSYQMHFKYVIVRIRAWLTGYCQASARFCTWCCTKKPEQH